MAAGAAVVASVARMFGAVVPPLVQAARRGRCRHSLMSDAPLQMHALAHLEYLRSLHAHYAAHGAPTDEPKRSEADTAPTDEPGQPKADAALADEPGGAEGGATPADEPGPLEGGAAPVDEPRSPSGDAAPVDAARRPEGGARPLGLSGFLALLRDHGALSALTVPRGGALTKPQRVALTEADATQAFACAARAGGVHRVLVAGAGAGSQVAQLLLAHAQMRADFTLADGEGLMEAVIGCALAKYGAVAGMQGAQMVEGMLHNLLGLADEHAVVVAAAAANAPRRYDFASAEPVKKGESAAERAMWMKLWPRLDLVELPGFPTWDKQVHDVLRPHCADLVSVFCHYCKQGGADGAGAGWRSMDEAEWAQMIREVEAPSPTAPAAPSDDAPSLPPALARGASLPPALARGASLPPALAGGASYGAALVASARVFVHVRGARAKDIGMPKFFQAWL